MEIKKGSRLFELLALIVSIVPIYFLFKTSPTEITGSAFIIFGTIIGIIVITLAVFNGYKYYHEIKDDVRKNKNELAEIQKDLNSKKQFDEMEIRLRVVESLLSKGKKGELLEFKIIVSIILIILLLLFLRVMKVI